MSYIDQTILPDETILYRTKKHYIVFLQPALWSIGALILFFNASPYVMYSGTVFALIAAFFWIITFLNFSVSEFAITNKRIIMREGFFVKHTNETRLSTIANVGVDQSIFGQILGYGIVTIKTYGGDDDPFSDIPNPFVFKKQLQTQLDQITK
jgi:uncharacterized membrane protein YdbT with pleckstrin-like domain